MIVNQAPRVPMVTLSPFARALGTRRGRLLIENVTAYLFLAPAGLLILLFGIFPVAFAFFVSLHRWRRFPDEYVGLANYEKALGNLGYILFFWLAIIALAASVKLGRRLQNLLRDSGDPRQFATSQAGFRGWLRGAPRHRLVLQADARDHADSAAGAPPKYDAVALYGKTRRKFRQPRKFMPPATSCSPGCSSPSWPSSLAVVWRFRRAEAASSSRQRRIATGIAGAGIFSAPTDRGGNAGGDRGRARFGRGAADLVPTGLHQRWHRLDRSRLAGFPARH